MSDVDFLITFLSTSFLYSITFQDGNAIDFIIRGFTYSQPFANTL